MRGGKGRKERKGKERRDERRGGKGKETRRGVVWQPSRVHCAQRNEAVLGVLKSPYKTEKQNKNVHKLLLEHKVRLVH